MARRASSEDEPGTPREVFELDKDERWQARLEEARARREVALREKAAGKPLPPRKKPWEIEGTEAPPEIKPIIQERGDDKFDFADRLENLKKDDDAKPELKPAVTDKPARSEKAKAAETKPPTDRPPAGEAIESLEPPKAARALMGRPPAGEAIDRLEPPKPSETKRKLTDRPPAGEAISRLAPPVPPKQVEKPVRSRPQPSLIVPGAPEVADLAARYAETLNPDAPTDAAVEPAAPEQTAPASEPKTRPRKRHQFRLPELKTRPGIRPLGMAWGLLALSALPLTTVAPPLEKGPPMPILAPFPVEPALGVTWSLYARPFETRAGEWRAEPAPEALAIPVFEPPAFVQRSVAPAPPVPGEGGEGTVDWSGVAAPSVPADRPMLSEPAAGGDAPAADVVPPAPEDASLDAVRPAPSRPTSLAERIEATVEEAVAEDAVAEAVAQVEPAIGTPLRITILTPQSADTRIAEDIAADVPRRGHELVRVREVDHSISERNLRYFHDSDRAEAARLARDYDAELRDFTWFRPSPVEGTAELWLSGRTETGSDPVPFVAEPPEFLRPITPDSTNRLLNRVMEGVGNALGAGLGLPGRDN